ncbi:5-methylcytosine-specific restriction enzyme subunit McrC [Pedobacter cryoconitis]|uniref:5-methylcytosine-specific restriction enzyme subunit McrC n=1 Tax=Pedobacter cryoconitis TaxID=188932 RepID=A0A7W9DYF5_9SPHI|nr:restriction endonuclease [Pedobacter cryoconitis]MBB5635154.1 5-methylcytosine-specific restriction enzyme subunit McrC [Pedobacter cryoconitis]
MVRKIQVFEHETLDKYALCNDGSRLGPEVIDGLWKYNDANQQKYFIGTRNGVKFKSYVGVIQISNTVIEILPKADKNKSADFDKWQNVLLQMLKISGRLKIESLTTADLNQKPHSILDLYFQLYLDQLEFLLHSGLFKKYQQTEGNILALKGSLAFSKNIQYNLVHKERFYTKHQQYTYDHLIHQILLNALLVLKNINLKATLTDRINRILFSMPEIKEVRIGHSHFESIVWDRKTVPYKEAINIARLIILNYSPDIYGGNENLIAILFDMNKLWEEFITVCLDKNLRGRYQVKRQNTRIFWNNKTIRPDIYFEREHSNTIDTLERFIIDTKWKIVEDNQPSDEDLKQIFAYNAHWGSKNSLLLYPTSAKDKMHVTGIYAHKFKDTDQHHCNLGFVNVIENGKLNVNFDASVLAMLEGVA